MPKPKEFPEEILDFAQSYLSSSLTLIDQFGKKPPYETIRNNDNGYMLCSYFLAAHGIELYFKFIIKLLGEEPPSNTHKLESLYSKVQTLLEKSRYTQGLFNEKEKKFIKGVDRYEKFRYPTNKVWQVIPEIFTESKKWNVKKSKEFEHTLKSVIKKLNNIGYEITQLKQR